MSTVLTRRTPRSGARIARLPIFVAVAIAGLWLFCSSAQTARMWMPKIENPYCGVSTYTLREVPEEAMSMRDSDGAPVIVISAFTLADKPAYGRFLMAHECCHHSLGHVGRFDKGLGQVGPQPFFYIAPALKQMELDADCCAIKMLKSRNEPDSIESAKKVMMSFGSSPTGAYYPTGIERAENIAKCAAEE